MTQVAMPLAARDRLLDRFGVAAAAWIDDFGAIVSELCQKWALDPLTVHVGGTGAVVECISAADGTRRALKLSPDPTITAQEAAALRYWADAHTVVDLMDADTTHGAILLEWLPEATQLTADTWVIAQVEDLIVNLFSPSTPPPPDVPLAHERVELMFELWDRRRRALPDSPIDDNAWRRSHAAALDMAGEGESLLHGDLHLGNLLRVDDDRGIVAIDPRPCVGDPAMDLTDLATIGAANEAEIRHRCLQLADIADPIDAGRLWLWCRTFAPMAAVSLARRTDKMEELTLMRDLAYTR